jgi:predicted short-subunit dehydrogenase-like oxidoreductase (DUF2520 family)
MAPDRKQPQLPTLNIIGCGRAAGCLARLWSQAAAVQLDAVLNRSRASSERAVQLIGGGFAVDRIADMPPADCWLIGSGDDQVLAVSQALAATRDDLDDVLVFHLAGRHGLEVLLPLAAQGARLAALHPVRSLTHAGLTLEEFSGTACVAEGSAEALAQLEPLVAAIGGTWLPVSDIDRGLYHAAVSIISNITKGVAWKAQNWLVCAGLPETTAVAVTHQLLASTMEDLFRSGARQSITGPLVRGDTRTIEAHLEALRATHPGDLDVYRILARTVLELAQERGDLDAATLARFDSLLKVGKE